MKILFICSCLEPGRDGVGDYTRRLAQELTRRGHSCFLLALKDRFVKTATRSVEPAAGPAGPETDNPIVIFRLPGGNMINRVLPEAKTFCTEAKPDWISLQLVLYGFDPRGLCFGLGAQLQNLCGKIPVQIMLHELWIGEAVQSSFKHKLLGRMQRHILDDLLRRLKPGVVHTHTPLYIHLLSKLGCSAGKLPLFGNVPVQTENADSASFRIENALAISTMERHHWMIFITFGSIHPEWKGEEFLERALTAVRATGKQMAFISIGRPGVVGEAMWKQLANREEPSCKLLSLGEQPSDILSKWLLSADLGVSSVPPEYLFKSGTAAALLEHGLPVITTRPVGRYPDCPESVLQQRLPHHFTNLQFEKMTKFKPHELLPDVAAQFADDLEQAGKRRHAS